MKNATHKILMWLLLWKLLNKFVTKELKYLEARKSAYNHKANTFFVKEIQICVDKLQIFVKERILCKNF